jgi:hypothetical protein
MGSNRGASREIFFKKKVSQGPWLTSSPICYFFFCNNTLPKKILFLPKKKGLQGPWLTLSLICYFFFLITLPQKILFLKKKSLTRHMVNIKPNMLLFSKKSLPTKSLFSP